MFNLTQKVQLPTLEKSNRMDLNEYFALISPLLGFKLTTFQGTIPDLIEPLNAQLSIGKANPNCPWTIDGQLTF